MEKKRLLIVGAGPGGYVAAIRAGQLGMDVVLAEENAVGGVCLNVGCIPTKALLSATELGHDAAHAGQMGVLAQVRYDLDKMNAFKDSCVNKLVKGVEFLLSKNRVKLVRARAEFTGPDTARVGDQEIAFDAAIIATGSRPMEIPGLSFDHERIISSTEALVINKPTQKLLIIGAGVIGLEMATVYARLGTQVEIVEMMPNCLPGADQDVVKLASQSLKKMGVRLHTSCKASSCQVHDTGATLEIETPSGKKVLSSDRVLVAVGRRPNTENLGLEAAGVQLDSKGFVEVDQDLRTSNPKLFAIGDVVGGAMLAHKASAQGLQVVENLAGINRPPARFIPSVVYTDPEIAWVGATEQELKQEGRAYSVGKFPFIANGRALTMSKTSGFIKLLADRETDRLLGAHMVGPHVSEMIPEMTMALENGLAAKQVARTVHPHPTLSEAVMESAEDLHGSAIHIVKLQKNRP